MGGKIGGSLGAAAETQKKRLGKLQLKDLALGAGLGVVQKAAGQKTLGSQLVEGAEGAFQIPGAKKVDTGSLEAAAKTREEAGTLGKKLFEQTQAKTIPTIEAERIARGEVGSIAPTQVQAGTTDAFRGTQVSLAQALQAQAAGTAPSVAELQAKAAGDRALAQQLALQAGAVGPGAALTRRTGQRLAAETGQEIARLGVEAKLKERQQAQGLLAQVASQGRTAEQQQTALTLQANLSNQNTQLKADLANQGVDLEVLKVNAAAGNTASLANLKASLDKQGLDNNAIANYLNFELGLSGQELKAALGKMGVEASQAEAAANRQSQLMGGLIQGAASIAAVTVSDRNLKTNITDGTKELHGFLESINVEGYDYKHPEKHGEGRKIGPMAQDLMNTEIGKATVIETLEGKMVDYIKLLPVIVAANVDAHKRISYLEKELKRQLKK